MSKEELKKYTVSTVFPNEEIMNDALNRKSSDEMFKELGYEKSITQIRWLKYYKDADNVIYFNECKKTFIKSGEWDGMCDDITMQELQAINEKCRELGWLDNNKSQQILAYADNPIC